MKYWFGYLTAGIFGAITWVLMEFGQRFSTLVDMVYPYVIRTMQGYLAEWTGIVDFPIWQLLAVVLGEGLMGVLGMLVFIPLTSVCYQLLREAVDERIRERNCDPLG